jgi:hypothetical protein
VLSRSRPNEEILQINAALGEPGGIVVEEEGKSGWLVPEICDQDLGSRPFSKQSFDEILFGNGCLSWFRPLVLSELEDELAYERDVFLRCLNNARIAGSALHRRIIRLAESGVNAIFRA